MSENEAVEKPDEDEQENGSGNVSETESETGREDSLAPFQEKLEELSPSKRRALLSYPVWNDSGEVKWFERDGLIVVEFPKNFSRFERWLHKKLGGPTTIRRPLDKVGSEMWRLCDGNHTLLEICNIIGEKYTEEVEPVHKTVPTFISQLFMLGLVIPKTKEELKREKAVLVEEVEL